MDIPWLSFGGIGVLAGVLFYLYTQALAAHREDVKGLHEQHAAEMKEERDTCRTAYEKLAEGMAKMNEALQVILQRLK
jgi:hypothetical protein